MFKLHNNSAMIQNQGCKCLTTVLKWTPTAAFLRFIVDLRFFDFTGLRLYSMSS